MALLRKAGRFNSPTSTGTQEVTGVGFQPQIILFFVSRGNTGAGASGVLSNAVLGIGAAVSPSSEAAFGVACGDSSLDDNLRTENARCITLYFPSGVPYVEADAELDAMLSDGFRVNWLTVDASVSYYVEYVALAGLEGAAVKVFQSPTSTGSQGITGVGFQPQAVLFLGGYQETIGIGSDDADAIVGFTDGAAHRCSVFSSEDSAPHRARCMRNDAAIFGINDTQTEMLRASVSSLDSDGFTLSWATVDASNQRYLLAVCLRGVSAKVASAACKTSTGTQAYTVATNHSTQALFLGLTGQTSHNSISTTEARLAAGVAVAAAQEFGRWIGKNTTNKAANAWSNAALLQVWNEGTTPTQIIEADLDSLDANGFTLNFTTASATARDFYYLSLAEPPYLDASGPMAGTSSGEADAEGIAEATGPMAGTSGGAATATTVAEATGPMAGTSGGAATATTVAEADGPMAGTSGGAATAGTVLEAAGPMAGTSGGSVVHCMLSCALPEFFPTQRVALPWPVTVGGEVRSAVTCDLRRVAFRDYDDGQDRMHVAVYVNDGPEATPGFATDVAVVGNVASFGYDGPTFRNALVRQLLAAWVLYRATALAVPEKPDPGLPDPPGIAAPLTRPVAEYAAGGGATPPLPSGTFAAFRLVPPEEYGTTDVVIEVYRGQ